MQGGGMPPPPPPPGARAPGAGGEPQSPWRWAAGGSGGNGYEDLPLRLYPPRRALAETWHTFSRVRYTFIALLLLVGASIFFLSLQFSLFEAGVRPGSKLLQSFGSALAWTVLVSLIPFAAALVLHELWLYVCDAADSLCLPAYRLMLASAAKRALRAGRRPRASEADASRPFRGFQERASALFTDMMVLSLDVVPLGYAVYSYSADASLHVFTDLFAAAVVTAAVHAALFVLLRAVPGCWGAARASARAVSRVALRVVRRLRRCLGGECDSSEADAFAAREAAALRSERSKGLLHAEEGETEAREYTHAARARPSPRLGSPGRRRGSLVGGTRLHGASSALRVRATAESLADLSQDEWPSKKLKRLLYEPLHGFWVADRPQRSGSTDLLDDGFTDTSDDDDAAADHKRPVYHGAFNLRVAARVSMVTVGAALVSELGAAARGALSALGSCCGCARAGRAAGAAVPKRVREFADALGTVRRRIMASGAWPVFVVFVGLFWLVGVNLLLAFVESRIGDKPRSSTEFRVVTIALYGMTEIWFGSFAARAMHSQRAFLSVIVFFCFINVLAVSVSSSKIDLRGGTGTICCDDSSEELGSLKHPYEVCAMEMSPPPYGNLSTTLLHKPGARGAAALASVVQDGPRRLDIVDFALFSSLAYYDHNDELNATLDGWYAPSGDDWYVRSVQDANVRFLDVYSPSRNLSVIAFRGTATGGDAIADMSNWYGSIFLGLSSLIMPLSNVLPLRFIQWFVSLTSSLQSALVPSVFDDSIDYAKSAEGSRRVVLAGHSLGAAVANIVAATNDQRSVAFSPPGVVWSTKTFGIELDLVASNTISVVPDRDPIAKIDMQGGLVQNIRCKDGLAGVECHSLYTTACVLWRSCVGSGFAGAHGRESAFDVRQGEGACVVENPQHP